MNRPLDDRTSDALLGGSPVEGEEALSAFVTDLQALAGPAPAPGAALAAMLEGGLVPDATAPLRLPRARRRWLLPVPLALGSLVAVGGLLGAASADVLPGPAQRVISDTVGSVTPIKLPKPAARPVVTPSPPPTLVPTPTQPVPSTVRAHPTATTRPTPDEDVPSAGPGETGGGDQQVVTPSSQGSQEDRSGSNDDSSDRENGASGDTEQQDGS